jgi:hypothetical protein
MPERYYYCCFGATVERYCSVLDGLELAIAG